MSEQKLAHVAISVNAGMSVRNGKLPGKVHARIKLLGLIFIALAILGITTALILWRHTSGPATDTSGKSNASNRSPLANTNPEQQAQYYADEGKYQSAELVLQNELADTKDSSKKVSIYYQQTAYAVQFKDYTDAKRYADEALQLAPNLPQPYAAEALLAQAQGNNAQAKQYLQQAISHVNSNTPGYTMIKSDYQIQLDALQ